MRDGKGICWLALVLVLATTGHVTTCKADTFAFTYSDSFGDHATGILTAAAGPYPLIATGGFIDVTSAADPTLALGIYPLLAANNGVAFGFGIDNALYTANDAPAPPPSYLTGLGLLFGNPGAPYSEINIWGNGGNNNYSFYDSTAGLAPPFSYTGSTPGTFTLQLIPEPSSLVLCGLGAVALLVASRHRRRA